MNNMTAAQAAQQNNRDNGGKYATKKVGEAEGVDLAAGQHQCSGCQRWTENDGCSNAACDEFNMAHPDAVFVEEEIRAHSVQVGDFFYGQVVEGVDLSRPGRPGRKARITTDTTVHSYGINDPVIVTRGFAEVDADDRYPGQFKSYVYENFDDDATLRIDPGNNDTYDAPGFSWSATAGQYTFSGHSDTLADAAREATDAAHYVTSGQAEADEWDDDENEEPREYWVVLPDGTEVGGPYKSEQAAREAKSDWQDDHDQPLLVTNSDDAY